MRLRPWTVQELRAVGVTHEGVHLGLPVYLAEDLSVPIITQHPALEGLFLALTWGTVYLNTLTTFLFPNYMAGWHIKVGRPIPQLQEGEGGR